LREDEAHQIVEAKNQAERQPVLNLQIAKAYLAGYDNCITTRTWLQAIESLTATMQDAPSEPQVVAVPIPQQGVNVRQNKAILPVAV
jgi:hypothetical protein